MKQKAIYYKLIYSLLGFLICLCGCDQKAEDTSTASINFAIDKPFYQGSLRVRVRVSDDQAVLSDLLTMELSAEIGSEYEVRFPDVAEAIKDFNVHSYSETPKIPSENDKIIKVYRYQLEPLKLGTVEIPAFTFTFKSKESTNEEAAEQTLTTEPIWIDIATSLPDDPNAFVIADINDVVEMKASYVWLWISLATACICVIGIAIGMAVKPKKKAEIPRVYKSAHEVAFELLKAIAAENLVEQGKIKEFYEKLSGCLRQYIENRFQLRAPEQTTEEFLEQLKTSDSLKLEHKQQLQKFLEHCDLVKFARYQPSNDQINETLTIAEEFVDKTKSDDHLVDVTESGQTNVEAAS